LELLQFSNTEDCFQCPISGLAESFSYAFLGIVNELILSHEEHPKMFLWLFIALSFCSFLAIIVTKLVSSEQQHKTDEETQKLQESEF
jgi:hypothetical protein